MRKLRLTRTGEVSLALRIDADQEKKLLSRLTRKGLITRVRPGLYLVPSTLPLGGKWGPGEYLILNTLMEDLSATYQICGPTAFNYHRFDDQVPNRVYVYNNRISGNRNIGGVDFCFIEVSDRRLGSTVSADTPDAVVAVFSSKARTLMDAVYDWSRFDGIPRAYGWTREALQEDKGLLEQLIAATAEFGNQGTIRRIGYLLETMGATAAELKILHDRLRSSASLIPWVPNLPARGPANRNWGVIANGE